MESSIFPYHPQWYVESHIAKAPHRLHHLAFDYSRMYAGISFLLNDYIKKDFEKYVKFGLGSRQKGLGRSQVKAQSATYPTSSFSTMSYHLTCHQARIMLATWRKLFLVEHFIIYLIATSFNSPSHFQLGVISLPPQICFIIVVPCRHQLNARSFMHVAHLLSHVGLAFIHFPFI